MATLGSFGRAYAKVDLDFDWFEAKIRVNPAASKASVVEFLSNAADVPRDDEVTAARLIMQMMREVIHPDDFDRFWAIAKRERQDPQTDIMPIAQAVIEATSGFPTGQPTASPGGPATTPPNSTAAGSSPVPQSTADRALALLRGRPDLQEFVVLQEESQRANGQTLSRS